MEEDITFDPEELQVPLPGEGGMNAMIFCAGLGTRFRPWTDAHPKALAMVNGKSLLQRNIEYLQSYNITDVIVNVHHFPQQVVEAIEKNDGWGSNISVSDETEELLETGGGLLKAQQLLSNGNPFITLNADILTDLNIDDLIGYHTEKKALISFGVTNRTSSRNFLFDAHERLCGWQNNSTGEKRMAMQSEIQIAKAYSCVAIFDPGIFELIPQRGKFSLVETYLSLAADHIIAGYDHSGDRFADVGKAESIAVAEALFA